MNAHRIRIALAALAAFVLLGTVSVTAAPLAANPPASPEGLTAIALDGKAALAWRPSADATSYQLYRGTSAGAITTLVTPAGYTGTSFTDNGRTNGTTYYYEVRATNASGQSIAGQRTVVVPRARSCTTGNAIRVENCFPGTANWKTPNATRAYPTGIEGFLSASSVDAGGAVELRVKTVEWDVPYHLEIYRTGYYGGTQGRLISTVPGLTASPQFCDSWPDTTGLSDCSGFDRRATISTTNDWVSGVYTVKIVRDDNGEYSEALLVVRDDGSSSAVLFGVPTNTYQAYNDSGGKSLYSYNSDQPNTVSTETRAVQVSFDRPYQQPTGNANAHDYYTRTDVATVAWLEQQGYDTTFVASEDIHTNGAQLQNHDVFISGAHDEYWTQAMFDAAVAARNAGTSLVFTGANAVYWRVRYLPSPGTGVPNRVMVGYKTIQSGPVDPSGISTSTFRDPAGPNKPENQLLGQMYIGDKRADDFPLRVSAAEGKHRFWRYTSVNNQADGATMSIGTAIVGWEWDKRFDNGLEPAGVQTLATSPVAGNVLQDNGRVYATANTLSNATIYTAASGAKVFATGTNNWWRGLALNAEGAGEPDARIQQATVNVLSDMGVAPTTPVAGLALDGAGAPTLTGRTPAAGATGVALGASVRATFNRELDPSTVGAGDVYLTEPGGATVPATLSLDNPTKSIVVQPSDVLEPNVVYTVRVTNGFKAWNGQSSTASTWTFTTGPGAPPTVLSRTPASGAAGVFTDAPVTARFDRKLNAATVTTSTFSLRPAAGGANVAATVSYDTATRTASLQPSSRLSPSTAYTATLTTGIAATDGIPMGSQVTWSFTTGTNVAVYSTFPADGASGLSTQTSVRAVFTRAVDAATVTSDAIRLVTSGGLTIGGTVTYDPNTLTATLVPASALAAGATFTATAGTGVRGADGAPTDTRTWSFTTSATPPPPPAATSLFPAAGATGVSNGAAVKVAFDRSLDPTTVTAANVTLTPSGGSPVAATVSYDDAARRITLTPLSGLEPGGQYTANVSTLVRSTTGAPPSAAITWSFTAADCPCALMSGVTPAWSQIPVRDYRPEPGPWTYELGTKVQVTETARLVALRFWKEPGETGTHVGRVWSSSGTLLASVTYQGESASGWQRQALATPLTLSPGQNYVISVGLNTMYAKTTGGLATQITAGPLRTVVDGSNGVFNQSAGSFPTESWQSSNYFVDGVVKLPAQAAKVPGVTTRTPAAGATGLPVTTPVTATFSTALDPSTVNATTFRLTDPGGAVVPAQVAYDDDTRTATLTPTSALDTGVSYTARLSTGIRSDDETPLPAAVNWTFATVPPLPPAVTGTSPVNGATQLGEQPTVSATFSQSMDASTITASSFTLTGPGSTAVPASVDYDPVTRTATLTPTSALASGTEYTARLSTAVESSRDLPLPAAYTWSFSTSSCPCQLFNGAYETQMSDLSTANGRAGSGWSLEMGVKVQVSQAASLRAIRFYKSPSETGTHVGRVWNASGQLLASTTFTGETGTGWQQQALASPVPMTPGQTYVVSVGMNTHFVMSMYRFTNPITSGPLSSIAGSNGVFADAAGTFPTQSWGDSDYGVDAVVR